MSMLRLLFCCLNVSQRWSEALSSPHQTETKMWAESWRGTLARAACFHSFLWPECEDIWGWGWAAPYSGIVPWTRRAVDRSNSFSQGVNTAAVREESRRNSGGSWAVQPCKERQPRWGNVIFYLLYSFHSIRTPQTTSRAYFSMTRALILLSVWSWSGFFFYLL